MIFVPLPFVVTLLLAILLVRMVRQSDGLAPERRPFLILIGLYALQSVLLGLRWGYDIIALMPGQAVLAALIAAFAWISFGNLARDNTLSWLRLAPHLLPAAIVLALMIFWRGPVGIFITATFTAYGAALIWLARHGPDGLVSSRLDGALLSYRSLLITAAALLASATADIVISFDFYRTGGAHAGAVVAIGNVISLLALGTAAAIASSSQTTEPAPSPQPQPQSPAPSPASGPTEEDGAIARSLDELMQSRELYRDPELNLGRIARRMNLPARRVSIAVNRVHGASVSQYVNDFRIRAACRMLETTDEPVTRLMFDCGFISKSNFNREFLRVTATNPTEYRRRHQTRPVSPKPAPEPEFLPAPQKTLFMSP
ncbi:helix-turn-helix domain-containing protein [Rhizobium sp. 16-449-1b]|uniref:helix-turn-helix domain-containing protein n=1 Tax=Rhizobium sp. 16-449-1b TaxID=2819989 RepID=UPI001ADC5411|nr:helix-turn-helix domain-containing protein [Rhizobium sp. 16-449-1b]MBO9197166.1 helix-turn-helix domain-containing protein [Rhizobium sp. 16-449-1b]